MGKVVGAPVQSLIESLVEELRGLCADLPGSEQYVMVHHPAFRVGKKPFVIVGMNEHLAGATLSINLGPQMQDQLLDDPRFSRTPYIGQHGWVTIGRSDVAPDEMSALVSGSWMRVANKRQIAQRGAGTPSTRNTATATAARPASKRRSSTASGSAKPRASATATRRRNERLR